MEWQPIETAPKDRPILVWHVNKCSGEEKCGPRRLCLFHGHAEGMGSVVENGLVIVEWGGAFDDRTWEDQNAGWMPDWWFQAGTDFETAANPTHWMPLPQPPSQAAEKGER